MRTLLALASSLLACTSSTADPEPSAAPAPQASHVATPNEPTAVAGDPQSDPVVASTDFAPMLREVASAYRNWGLVDNQFHWAPGLCALPSEGVAHYSTVSAPAAHAEKVFVLYALDPMAYWKATDAKGPFPETLKRVPWITGRQNLEQVLVKESFVPTKPGESKNSLGFRVSPAKKGEEYYTAGEPMGLFVMARLEGSPAGTDEGWVYATIAPDGEIRESGNIAACHDCHAKEKDRIFGVPLAWK
jgi:hypothetical protein